MEAKHIVKLHNKKLISSNNQVILSCNCRRNEDCPVKGICRANDVVYKFFASATSFPNKVYLGTAQGKF